MNSSPVLWNEEEDGKVQPSLRPPQNIHESNNSQLVTQTESQKLNLPIKEHSQQNGKLDFETILQKSSLNVNACEWYPTKPVESILEKSSLNVNAGEWYPKNYAVCPRNPVCKSKSQDRLIPYEVKPTNSEENVGDEQMNSKSSPDLFQIYDVINTLTENHGQFYEFLEKYLESLEPDIPDVKAPSILAEVIVEHAFNNPNFRYTAARLCSFIEQKSPRFRAELHLICIKLIEGMCDAKNVLPLIAELYTQIPYFNIFGNLLIYAFKKILEFEEINNVKCICQVLKSTGYSLEQSNKVDLDQIFNELEFVKGSVDGTADGILLESIFQLRASNWDHSTKKSDSDQDDAAFDGLQSKKFHEVDGETAEEREKIQEASNEFVKIPPKKPTLLYTYYYTWDIYTNELIIIPAQRKVDSLRNDIE